MSSLTERQERIRQLAQDHRPEDLADLLLQAEAARSRLEGRNRILLKEAQELRTQVEDARKEVQELRARLAPYERMTR